MQRGKNWNQTEPMDAILLLPCDYVVNCLVRRCKYCDLFLTVSDVVHTFLPFLSELFIDNEILGSG